MTVELWRSIPGLDGYEASTLGRIRSRRKILTASPGGESSPYLRVTISAGGRKLTRRVHNLVLVTFVGPQPPGTWGLHNDGDHLNNRPGNLRWGTPKENADDRLAHGRTMLGARNHKARLTAADVPVIRELYAAGTTQCDLADRYGISQPSVSALLLGKTWRHLA